MEIETSTVSPIDTDSANLSFPLTNPGSRFQMGSEDAIALKGFLLLSHTRATTGSGTHDGAPARAAHVPEDGDEDAQSHYRYSARAAAAPALRTDDDRRFRQRRSRHLAQCPPIPPYHISPVPGHPRYAMKARLTPAGPPPPSVLAPNYPYRLSLSSLVERVLHTPQLRRGHRPN